ncbi:LysE family translocator [Streptomyces sp. NPDC047002]|uniref:LysE family translocator n=1 Tax=Streptomyces sp. NPDC047002 TaxID=3155475 RepID=UPI0034549AE4
MVEGSQLLGITAATALLIVVPGPSVLFVIGRALSGGYGRALASVAGNTLGCAAAATAITLGLGPFIQRSDLVLAVIRYAGAAYLVWLGIRGWRTAGKHQDPAAEAAEAAEPPEAPANDVPGPAVRRAFLPGILVGVSNPKVYILFAAILPQFVAPHSTTPLIAQMLILALVPLLIGLLSDSAWALLAGSARSWFLGSRGRLRTVNRAGAAAIAGLGATIALEGLRQN